MSVDTNTRGKNLSRYARLEIQDVELLVPHPLVRWAAQLTVDAKRSLLGSRFVVAAGHAHSPG